jgi:probable HAF family extracellular repeat protein
MMSFQVRLIVIACGIAVAIATTFSGATLAAQPLPHYTLVDPGTFGGPQSFFDLPATPLTHNGTFLGQANTSTPDSDAASGGPDPYVLHAFAYRGGQLVDLGALPGENSSAVFEMTDAGIGAGGSENGLVDPVAGVPATHAVLFDTGRVIDIGALPGGNESFAVAITNAGLVAGFSSNGTPDSYSCLVFCWGTQTRTFVWQNGTMTDIGTLGGGDNFITTMNDRGQIAGNSFTNDTPNATTGLPTMDPYLWDHGRFTDLGTLGGTFGDAQWLNAHGQVVGESNLAGDDRSHPYLWDGHRMIDLGTLGGDNGVAIWVNNPGDVVGKADLPDGTHYAFLWHQGSMKPLLPLYGAPCSYAASINDRGQIVGNASDCHGHFVDAQTWIDGVPYDLNSLIPTSPLHLTEAIYIANDGSIVGEGELANGDRHVYMLVPNDH